MDVHEAIRTRYAVRDFRPDPLPDETITKILEAGRLAPSQQNRQQWHFVVVRDRETLKTVGELSPSGGFIAGAPMAVAVVMRGAKMAQVDAARAVEGVTNSGGAEADWSRTEFALVGSNGFAGAYAASRNSVGVSVLAGEGTAMERDYDYAMARYLSDLEDPAAVGTRAGRRTVATGARRAEHRPSAGAGPDAGPRLPCAPAPAAAWCFRPA